MRRPAAIIPLAAAVLLTLFTPAMSQNRSDLVAPEAAGPVSAEVRHAIGRVQMVVAANPYAARAGQDVLRQGGSAADAAIAVQMVLGLVEPQSSGLGGGAFALFYDAQADTLSTFDARETAPFAAGPDLFLDDSGEPFAFFDAVIGGRSVGVPGVPALFDTLHEKYGTLSRKDVAATAITLAEDGFIVSPRLSALLLEESGRLDRDEAARAYFFDADGVPVRAGTLLRNPAYAKALKRYAAEGASPFYESTPAQAIVAATTTHETNPGRLAPEDFTAYRIVERPPVCVAYRAHDICGMGPPSSGGLTIGQILAMLEPFDLATLGPDDPESWRLIGDATRLAFADRGRYMADSDFTDIPKGLLDRTYLEGRADLLRRPDAIETDEIRPGEPPWDDAQLREDAPALEAPATTHFVIVDKTGNIASVTSSIENAFGARIMANGYLLNNQLTDFSFLPEADDKAVANRVEPGKRPRSSMAPTIVFKDGVPLHVLGSPGGASIIPYVARTIIALIDWEMDMAEAIALPHKINMFGPYLLEADTAAVDMAPDLEVLGYSTDIRDMTSGLHGVTILDDGTLFGAADPRREGVALAD